MLERSLSKRQKQISRDRKKKQKKMLLIILVIMILALTWKTMSVQVIEKVKTMRMNVSELEWGEIEETHRTTAILTKNEQVVYSPAKGSVELKVKPGEKVSVGQVIAEIEGGFDQQFSDRTSHEVKAPKAGIVSLNVDGWESILSERGLEHINYSEIENNISIVSDIQPEEVGKGDPLLKIINNLTPVTVLVSTDKLIEKIEVGEKYKIKFLDQGHKSEAIVLDKQVLAGKEYLLLEINNYKDETLAKRIHEVDLVLQDYEGIIVNINSIINIDGESSILVIQTSGRSQWKPVEIYGKIEQEIAIRGVPAGLLYVEDPEI